MTTIAAEIIKDSVSVLGKRITTMQLRYPRFVHAEFMTHRALSRNASSSRAIPVSRLIDDIIRDTAMPIHWGKNQKGMQADEECNELGQYGHTYMGEGIPEIPNMLSREELWDTAKMRAIEIAEAFDAAGYHKQVVNRLLEPFAHINVVVTATEWDNFFSLRRHKDAEPHIHMLADAMYEAMDMSTPEVLYPGSWHLPYVTKDDWDWDMDIDESGEDYTRLISLSVARCARVSYLTHEGKKPSHQEDLDLYTRLVGSHPIHASPAEHQAMCGTDTTRRSNNFVGWRQYREMLQA